MNSEFASQMGINDDEVRIEGALPQQLRAWRLMSNMSQSQVAIGLGLSPTSYTYIYDWEIGLHRVPEKYHERLEDLYYIEPKLVKALEEFKSVYKSGMTVIDLKPMMDAILEENDIVTPHKTSELIQLWVKTFLEEDILSLTDLVVEDLRDSPKTMAALALATNIEVREVNQILSPLRIIGRVTYDSKTKLWGLSND